MWWLVRYVEWGEAEVKDSIKCLGLGNWTDDYTVHKGGKSW